MRATPLPTRLIAILLLCTPPAVAAETLIVLNKAEATASLIDLETGAERARLATGDGPHEVAVSSDGRLAVVTNYGGRRAGDSLSVIDLSTPSVTRTLSTAPFSRPHGIEFVDEDTLIVTLEADRSVALIDLDGRIGTAFETDQGGSHMLVLSPDGSRVFVANMASGSATAIDLADGSRRIVPTGDGAEGIAVTPDGDELWVTNREDDSVSILDASSLRVLATVPAAGFPIRVKFAPDGSYAVVSGYRNDTLTVIDRVTRRTSRVVVLPGRGPIGVLFHPDGDSLFVALTRDDRVLRLSTDDWSVTDSYEVGANPDGLGLSLR
jgi:YVTN family beta-propeller protein